MPCGGRVLGPVVAVLLLSALTAASGSAQTAPTVVGRTGYINGTPLSAHTTAPFDSTGASTLVAFVSSHPTWNGQPVSFDGLTDNFGNTWHVLVGPTTYPGGTYTLMSSIYYVTAPITGQGHTVTVHLTNPVPLVAHVAAVAGAAISAPPVYSAITGPGGPAADVVTESISVPASTLLLAWVKNENVATATAQDAWTLDPQSTSFLWAEVQTAASAGSYQGHFTYSGAIGWQTAIVGLTPSSAPVASSQAVTTDQDVPVEITLTAVSPGGLPLTYTVLSPPVHGQLAGTAPHLTYTPDPGYGGSDGFSFQANDGTEDSNVGTVGITVRVPNRAPVAEAAVVLVGNSTPTAITLVATDADGDLLTYTVLTAPAQGVLSGTPPNLVFTPTAGFSGGDTFTFKASDGAADSNVATVSLSVWSAAAAPAVVGRVGYINGTPLSAHTTAPVSSVGASTLVAFVSSHPTWNGQPVSFDGLTDSLGNSWHVLVGPTVYAGGSYTLMSAIYYVTAPTTGAGQTVTVHLTNPAPLVAHVIAVSGAALSTPPIYSTITDPGGPSADVVTDAITVPANTLLLAWTKNENVATAAALDGWALDPQSTSFLWAGSLTAGSAGSYHGRFAYSSVIAWQSAIVGLVPSATPVASNQAVATDQDVPAEITLVAVSPGALPLTYTVLTAPLHGQLSGTAPNLTYTPDAGYRGADAFTFKANDGTADSNLATVTISVAAVNHPPVASGQSVATLQGTAVGIVLGATDADGDPLTYGVVAPPAHGVISGVAPNLVYTPLAGYTGADSFTFRANDGVADSNEALVSLAVQAVPPGPTVVGRVGYINATPLSAHTTAPFVSAGASTLVAFVSSHPVWNGLPVSVGSLTDNFGNTWSLLAGPATYPGATYELLSSVYYVSAPRTGAGHKLTLHLTNPASLVVHVFAVSGSDITAPPVHSTITGPDAGPSAEAVSETIDVPSSTLLLAWAKNENTATATVPEGWTLDPQSTSFLWAKYRTSLAAGPYTGHFTYSNPIGWHTAVVGVTRASGPVASNLFVTVGQDTPAGITLAAVSPDVLPLTYTVLTAPAHGQLSGIAPDLIYTPDPGYPGGDAFTYKANDGTADSNVATVTIAVVGVNHAPVANDQSVVTSQDASVAVTLTATEVDGDPLTYSVLTPPAHGHLSGTGPNLAYTPDGGYAGTDAFTFKANDGAADSNVGTVTITIQGVPPTLSGFTPSSGPEGTLVAITGTGLSSTTLVRFDTTDQTEFTVVRSFGAAVSFGTNAGPVSLAVGDLDGDGRPDLAASNYGFAGAIGSSVSVLLNQSTGGTVAFAPKVDLATSPGPHEVEIGDIDGDGKPDVVTANYGAFGGGRTVSVLRNTSTAGIVSFEPGVEFDTTGAPSTLAVGDLDGDGRPDLVVANFDDGRGATISVLRNVSAPGTVTLEPRVDYATDIGPYGVTLGDLDGDGRLDVAVGNFGSFAGEGTTVSVLRNTSTSGTISLAPKMDVATSSGPRFVAIRDIDGDGRADLLVASYGGSGSGNSLAVMRNTSSVGSLSFAAEVDFPTGAGPMKLAVGDVDQDGKPDVLTANYGNGVGATVSLLRNTSTTGTFGFEPKVDYAVGLGPHGVAIRDLDGDGWLDITTADYGTLQGSGRTVSVRRSLATDDSQIIARVPEGATTGPIHVTTTGGTATTAGVFTVLPAVSVDDVTVTEGDGGAVAATFTVTLSRASSQTVSVDYAIVGGTATAGSDYTATSGTLTLAPGATSGTLTVSVLGDTRDEQDETYTVALSNVINGAFGKSTGLGTILDDDPVPSLSIGNVTVTEGDSGSVDAGFTVTLSAASGQPVTVNYATVDGTATDADYSTTSGTLTFAPGTTSQTMAVPVLGDTLDETSEAFTVTLTAPVNAILATATGTGTITDNDPAPSLAIDNVAVTEGDSGPATATFTVTLSAASGRLVTVNYATANGTATAGSDYTAANGTLTFAPGTTSKTIAVTVLGDTVDEPNETLTVGLSGAVNATIADASGAGTVTDDDPPAISIGDVTVTETNSSSTSAAFTVTLSTASTQTVTVNYTTANGTATSGADYAGASGSLSFTAGATSRTITVTVLGDTLDEPNETFAVNLSGAVNATIADGTGTGTITDNDATPSLSISNSTVTEGNSGSVNATFTVTLSAASGQIVTVNYATANGTATAGADYTATSGTLTFAPGTTTRTIGVAVLGDTLDEPNETYLVSLSGAANAAIADGSGAGTITDNDPTPSLSINNVTVTEGNSGTVTATFTVTLSAASGRTVTVNYATSNGTATAGGDYTATSGTLTFAAGATSATIAVTILGGTTPEPTQSFNMNLSSASNASIADATGVCTILDND